MRYSRRRFLTAAAAAGAALAGCLGDSTSGTATTTATGTPTATATGTPTATPASAQQQYPDYSWETLEGVDPVATDTVAMSGFAFDPLVAAVAPGTTVTFENKDGSDHTVTAPRLGINRSVAGGESTSFTVDRTGTFDYVCTLHPPDMVGRLVVTEDA